MGQRRSKRRAVQFQGIPGGVARGSVPGRVATSRSTPVGSKRRGCDLKSFVYTRVAWWVAITKSNLDFVYNWSLSDSVYTRSLPSFCLYQVISRFCLYQVVLSYSQQCPWDGERLGGRNTPVEPLRRHLRDGLREARLLGNGACWGWLVLPISTTVGSWAWRPTAATSGRAASYATLVSGRWASVNSGYTIPGLSLIASPASRLVQVI